MPVQKTDRNTTWNVSSDNKTWTLATNAKISVENQHGIDENGFSGSSIRMLGDIAVTGNSDGVHLTGSNSSVFIGESSRVNANNAYAGIHLEGAGSEVTNNGRVNGGTFGILCDQWAAVENNGKITSHSMGIAANGAGAQIINNGSIDGANYGIEMLLDGSSVTNGKNARIEGYSQGIVTSGTGEGLIVNKGQIAGSYNAVQDGDGALTLINRGTLTDGVSLGGGDDTLDTRHGTITGAISGGAGDDKFFVSKQTSAIREYDGQGNDEVVSTASFKLSDWIEKLTLIGKKDVNATGNALDNLINGNRGDNQLFGHDGVDHLIGGRGADILAGGTEADVFLFKRTDGKDVINDFEDGMDRLSIAGVYNQETFDELDIRQAKNDLIVDFGNGNEIRIKDMAMANFTSEDFFMA